MFSDVTRQKRDREDRGIPYCEERRRLTDAVLTAIRELMQLQSKQTQAIIEQDRDFARFDDLIHMARVAKDDAKYRLMAHIGEHKC